MEILYIPKRKGPLLTPGVEKLGPFLGKVLGRGGFWSPRKTLKLAHYLGGNF